MAELWPITSSCSFRPTSSVSLCNVQKLQRRQPLGAAYLAGLAVGFWNSPDELAQQWAIDRTFEPRMSTDQREHLYTGWKRAVERSLCWTQD